MQPGAWAQTASVNDVIQSDTMRAVATQSMLAQAAYALSSETSDTDADNVPEPLAMATGTGPTGGGVIPAASGAPKTDGFGRAIGYCAFDIGATNASTGRISGAAAPSPSTIVFAAVSAGIDGVFGTSCATLPTGGSAGGDDLVVTYNLLQVRMGMGGSAQWGNSVAGMTELNWLATNAASQLRDGEVRLRRDTSQLYRWNTATSAWSLVNASPWASSGTTVSYTGGDVQVSRLQAMPSGASRSLFIGGNGRAALAGTLDASVATTDGSLYLDAGTGKPTYLNWTDGNALYVGKGNGTARALVDANGMTLYEGGFNVGSTKLTDNSLAFSQGGGWYMSDATWIRAVNDKGILTGGTVSAATIRATASGGVAGNFGAIASSWAGSTSYPTFYSDNADRWVMHINPHVSYTQPGVNGFSGTMTGATIRMASNAAASTYWDIGIGNSGVGADKFAIGRAGTALMTLTNAGVLQASRIVGVANPGAASDGMYVTQAFEARSNDGSPAGIGFHRAGFSAATLYHGGDGDNLLRLRRWAGGDYKVWHEGADAALVRSRSWLASAAAADGITSASGNGIYGVAMGGYSNLLVHLGGAGGSTPSLQLMANYNDELYFRASRDSETQWDGQAGGNFHRILHTGNAQYAAAMDQYVRTTDSPTFGGMTLTGDITVHSGGAWSTISMADADEGMRYVHNNSGTIGFLGSDGGWTMRVADDGNIWSKLYGDWLSNVMARRNSTNNFSAQNYFHSNNGAGSYLGNNVNPALQAYSTDGGAAFMSFHRGGYYAVNVGLDPDNVFRIGGWSASANRLSLDMSGNLSVTGNISAPGTVTAARFEQPGINASVGTNALKYSVGIGNSAFGYQALSMIGGNYNTAVGASAAAGLIAGSYNTLIGAGANSSDTLQYATAVGAGSSVTTSNTIALGRASDSVVIGGSAANPSYKFYVNGAAGGTTGWNTYSDGRLKRNVESISADPLAVIMKLKPVRYEFRHEEFPGMKFAHGQQIGFIAQDLEQIVPEVVKTGVDGYKMVEYAPLTALLTAGVQELQNSNVAMQHRVSTLES